MSSRLKLEKSVSEGVWIFSSCCVRLHPNRLVADDSSGAVHSMRIQPGEYSRVLGSSNEERLGAVDTVQTRVIYIPSVHNIAGSRLKRQHIQDLHIVHFAIGNMYKCGDAPT